MIAVMVSSPLGKLLHQYEDINLIPHKKNYLPLLHWLKEHKTKLVPTFPGIEEDSMQVYFTLQSTQEISEEDLVMLRSFEGIEAAYQKGEDSLPG